jgi:hypothetical protein
MNSNWYAFLARYKAIIIFVLFDLLFLVIILPFWRDNNLTSWDFVGHLSAINYTENSMFPDFQAWNPYYSLGYPQGSFYPPIIHYLIAGLSRLAMNPFFWIKVLFTINLIALPWMINYFVEKFYAKVFKTSRSSITLLSTLGILLVIVFGPTVYGGTLKSFLIVGLINNFFILNVFFYFLGKVISLDYKNIRYEEIVKIAFVLAVIILSHLVTGLFSIVFIITLYFFNVILIKPYGEVGKRILKSGLSYILLVAFLCTAFFYLPYLVNSKLIAPILVIRSDKYIIVAVTISLIVGLFVTLRQKSFDRRHFLVLWSIIALCTIICIAENIFAYLKISFPLGAFHPYRLLSFAMIFSPIFLISGIYFFAHDLKMLRKWQNGHLVNRLAALAVLGLVLIAAIGIWRFDFGAESYGEVSFNEENIKANSAGNYMSFITVEDGFYLYRAQNYPDISIKTPVYFVNTQFNESSFVNSYAAAAKTVLYSDPKNEYKFNKSYPETYMPNQEEAIRLLKIMNVKYLIFTDKDKFKVDLCDQVFDYALIKSYRPKESEMQIYGCNIKPEIYAGITLQATPNWKSTNWLDLNYEALYDCIDLVFLDTQSSDIGGNAEVYQGPINWKSNNQSFEIENYSDSGMTIIPVQYNPRWKATNEDGTRLAIYRVTPNLMAIEGKGKINFKYEQTQTEQALKILSLSIFTLLGLATASIAVLRLVKKVKSS